MFAATLYKKPIIIGIAVAAIIHSIAIVTRELFPIPLLAPIVDAIAFNGSWVYLSLTIIFMIINGNRIKHFFACIPERISLKTVKNQKLILGYESFALFILLIIFPAITYFYSKVYVYFNAQHPQLHRFFDYMPFTDLINRAMTSFPFFITLFALVSLLCVIMPHTYLTYKYADKSPDPLRSAILFSIVLSIGITATILALLAFTISFWMLAILLLGGPIILCSYIIVNVMMLRYHDKFMECE